MTNHYLESFESSRHESKDSAADNLLTITVASQPILGQPSISQPRWLSESVGTQTDPCCPSHGMEDAVAICRPGEDDVLGTTLRHWKITWCRGGEAQR